MCDKLTDILTNQPTYLTISEIRSDVDAISGTYNTNNIV